MRASPEEADTAERRLPHPVWLRAVILALVVAAGFALTRWTPLGEFLNEERIVAALEEVRRLWWSPLLLLALYSLMALLAIPTAPLLVAGAIFGPVYGSVLNTTGLMLGATLSYGLARILGRDFVLHLTGTRVRRAEKLFHKHGFWPLVQTRFLPLPFPVVNFGSALAGVPLTRFLGASLLGLVPSTLIHTFFIATLIEVHGRERILYLILYAASFGAFNLAIGVPWWREQRARRRRYREILARRAQREENRAGTIP